MNSIEKTKARKISSYDNFISKIRFPKFESPLVH